MNPTSGRQSFGRRRVRSLLGLKFHCHFARLVAADRLSLETHARLVTDAIALLRRPGRLTAVGLGLWARHWLSLARRSRIGARSEDQVQRALAALQGEGWRKGGRRRGAQDPHANSGAGLLKRSPGTVPIAWRSERQVDPRRARPRPEAGACVVTHGSSSPHGLGCRKVEGASRGLSPPKVTWRSRVRRAQCGRGQGQAGRAVADRPGEDQQLRAQEREPQPILAGSPRCAATSRGRAMTS